MTSVRQGNRAHGVVELRGDGAAEETHRIVMQVLQLAGLELRCIHTPGHTPGHMVLYLPRQRLLFSGDHILFDITPNIAVWSTVPHSLADYLASLDKLRGLLE